MRQPASDDNSDPRDPTPASTELLRLVTAHVSPELGRGFERLLALLAELDRVIVAYSGGVDSAFLLRVAHAVLGERVLGVLAVSESLDRNESRAAREFAEALGMPLRVVTTNEYARAEYRRNAADRCYHCKTELFTVLDRLAREEGFSVVLDGSNLDDAGDFRPGMRARSEQAVRSPLQEAELSKSAIRELSRALGMSTWDKPAAPCLSSRIPYGSEVTAEKLRAVEAAEAGLRDLGFTVLRVRHHGDVARIEVPAGDLPRFLDETLRERIVESVKAAGFRFVALDVEGFRSGGLNEALSDADRGAASFQAAPTPRPIPPSEIGIFS